MRARAARTSLSRSSMNAISCVCFAMTCASRACDDAHRRGHDIAGWEQGTTAAVPHLHDFYQCLRSSQHRPLTRRVPVPQRERHLQQLARLILDKPSRKVVLLRQRRHTIPSRFRECCSDASAPRVTLACSAMSLSTHERADGGACDSSSDSQRAVFNARPLLYASPPHAVRRGARPATSWIDVVSPPTRHAVAQSATDVVERLRPLPTATA
jgi:hypothetical protein